MLHLEHCDELCCPEVGSERETFSNNELLYMYQLFLISSLLDFKGQINAIVMLTIKLFALSCAREVKLKMVLCIRQQECMTVY